ncbi:hypothetical protein MNV49_002924 [Pseudohyphozyma bogoriensis]|nr:hypothetical protein MNV49_002924 [Pseudohyphozyma bogoriensis]
MKKMVANLPFANSAKSARQYSFALLLEYPNIVNDGKPSDESKSILYSFHKDAARGRGPQDHAKVALVHATFDAVKLLDTITTSGRKTIDDRNRLVHHRGDMTGDVYGGLPWIRPDNKDALIDLLKYNTIISKDGFDINKRSEGPAIDQPADGRTRAFVSALLRFHRTGSLA